jgi:hypothetical protein
MAPNTQRIIDAINDMQSKMKVSQNNPPHNRCPTTDMHGCEDDIKTINFDNG